MKVGLVILTKSYSFTVRKLYVPSYGLPKPTKASGCTAEEKRCQIEDIVAEKEKVLPVPIIVNHDTI